MARKTNAVRLLDRAGIEYQLAEYDLAIEDFSAEAVAELIGLPSGHVFKTLLVRLDPGGPAFAVVGGDAELDLKALARSAGAKRAALVPLSEVEPLTGYVRGGVTVLGAKKPYPAYLDEAAIALDAMVVSAGVKGLQIALAPADYVAITEAAVAAIARR